MVTEVGDTGRPLNSTIVIVLVEFSEVDSPKKESIIFMVVSYSIKRFLYDIFAQCYSFFIFA